MKQHAKKWFSGFLAVMMTLTALFVAPDMLAVPVSAAATQQEINSLKEDANSLAAQKNELKQQLDAVSADKNKALEQKNLLEKQINVIQEEIDNISSQISKYDDLIAVKAKELAENEQEEERQYDLFCQRVRMMEEEGEVSYWSILFHSSSFSELLDRFMMVEEIMEYDNAIMDQLRETRKQIEQDKAEMEDARQEQEAARKVQEAAKSELKTQETKVMVCWLKSTPKKISCRLHIVAWKLPPAPWMPRSDGRKRNSRIRWLPAATPSSVSPASSGR